MTSGSRRPIRDDGFSHSEVLKTAGQVTDDCISRTDSKYGYSIFRLTWKPTQTDVMLGNRHHRPSLELLSDLPVDLVD